MVGCLCGRRSETLKFLFITKADLLASENITPEAIAAKIAHVTSKNKVERFFIVSTKMDSERTPLPKNAMRISKAMRRIAKAVVLKSLEPTKEINNMPQLPDSVSKSTPSPKLDHIVENEDCFLFTLLDWYDDLLDKLCDLGIPTVGKTRRFAINVATGVTLVVTFLGGICYSLWTFWGNPAESSPEGS